MVDVAFVCLGNICRSTPMAEAIMRQRLKTEIFMILKYIQEVLVAGI